MEKIALKHDLDEELAIARQKIESLQNRVVQMESEHDHAKAIASALRQSEERYKYFFENSPMGIYRTTPDGRILLCNPQLIKMLGFDSLEESHVRILSRCVFRKAGKGRSRAGNRSLYRLRNPVKCPWGKQ